MQYDCGDILFDFFFRDEYAITWSVTSADMCLNLGAATEAQSDLSLAVASQESAGLDLMLAVESSNVADFDTAFELKAMSVSSICLGVEGSGWRDNNLSLKVGEQSAVGNHQALLHIREEDWFTN